MKPDAIQHIAYERRRVVERYLCEDKRSFPSVLKSLMMTEKSVVEPLIQHGKDLMMKHLVNAWRHEHHNKVIP